MSVTSIPTYRSLQRKIKRLAKKQNNAIKKEEVYQMLEQDRRRHRQELAGLGVILHGC